MALEDFVRDNVEILRRVLERHDRVKNFSFVCFLFAVKLIFVLSFMNEFFRKDLTS